MKVKARFHFVPIEMVIIMSAKSAGLRRPSNAEGHTDMTVVELCDVGTTRRLKLTQRQRLAIWERARGICVLCERPIDGVRERWIIEHLRALELGGPDEPDNMGPAHESCGLRKTQDDHRRTAKAKRQKIRHLGAAQSKRPMPCGRQSRWRKRLDGTIVLRE
ncbi:HNH endonuclease signature motif containing protein [Microvirga zambiensis]|uniref:HNH endonuclease signature motif containing protein n=1 Tax=Microvirga zambiensis TaxID=1402137 RepID=UPI001920128D|nr:HNH endonuclease signature motif containing protein [Microvirga zambiensis]